MKVALRRKIAHDQEIAKLRGMAATAETMAGTLEGSALDAEHLEAMRS